MDLHELRSDVVAEPLFCLRQILYDINYTWNVKKTELLKAKSKMVAG